MQIEKRTETVHADAQFDIQQEYDEEAKIAALPDTLSEAAREDASDPDLKAPAAESETAHDNG